MSSTKKPATARSFAEIREKVRRRQTTVNVCLAGDLAARADEIETELEALKEHPGPSSLAEVDPRMALLSELDELRVLMRDAEVVFRFQALGATPYSDLIAAHPPRKGTEDGAWNIKTFPNALIAATCIEPEMTVEQVDDLFEELNQRQRNDIWGGAWTAQVGETRVPISRAASTSL